MSIGVLCHPGLGGSGVIAIDLAQGMAERGHRVHVIATRRPMRAGPGLVFHEAEAPDHDVFQDPPYPMALAAAAIRVAREESLDLLHVHYAVPHAVVAWLAAQSVPGLKTVVTLHGTDVTMLGQAYEPVLRPALAAADLVTVPSRFLREAATACFGIQPEVVPNFVDLKTFHPGAAEPRFANGDPVLVHVSNFRPLKRVDLVLQIFEQVLAERAVNLLLIGDGPDLQEVRAKAARFGARVQFAGRVDEVAPLLRGSAALLLPSETESFGLAALEAQACGVPVVASAVGGLAEVVQDGVTGFLCPADGPKAMASAVLKLLESPPDPERLQMNANRFDRESALDTHESLYDAIRKGGDRLMSIVAVGRGRKGENA